MSYRLGADQKLRQGARRIALEEIGDALAYLNAPEDDLDEAVHESRKCFKKLRGLLRLFRKEIGEEVYHRENRCFRDAGRLLADLRDSYVRIETVDDLKTTLSDSIDEEAIATMRRTLAIFYHATCQRVVEEEQGLAKAAEMIEEARQRVDSWPIEEDSFGAFSGGLRKIYRRGRNRLKDASDSPTNEVLHEWRKRVKYLWYSTRLLRPIWLKPMRALANEIHDLSDYLGDDHDLAELQAFLEGQPTIIDNDVARKAFINRIEHERTDLQARAFLQGQRIYSESPKRFVGRLGAYWVAMRDEIESGYAGKVYTTPFSNGATN